MFLSMAVLALMLVLAGCVRKAPPLPPPAEPVYPYRSDTTKVFYATPSGLSEMTFQGEGETEMLLSSAPNGSVLSSDGRGIAVAVNGWGIEKVEASSDGRAYRLVDSHLPGIFSGLSTGGAWPLGGGFLFQLYRDPFSDPAEAGASVTAPASAFRLVFFGREGMATTLDPFPPGRDAGFELFALLPAGGTWFAELRKDAAERVDFEFFAIDDPLAASSSAREIHRADFEAALMPVPFSDISGEVGTSLRSALALLGTGPWLARIRSDTGEDRWYLSSGNAEEATKVFVWTSAGDSARVLVLGTDGRLALSDGRGEPVLTSIAAPVEGAAFTTLAAAGNIAAAAWEAGEFPFVSSAGIVLTPLR